jgi:hypothetical protein
MLVAGLFVILVDDTTGRRSISDNKYLIIYENNFSLYFS